jgi:chromate transport protein ChrA
MLAGAGLLAGAWALLPPYTGPALNTAARVEFADHVVPGVVVVAVSALALAVARRTGVDRFMFAAGLGIVLAGFWMVATHLPLVLQATTGQAPWAATVYHSLPGVAVLVLGVVWAAIYRADPPAAG